MIFDIFMDLQQKIRPNMFFLESNVSIQCIR